MTPTRERREPQRKRSSKGPRRPAKRSSEKSNGPLPEELKPILDPPAIETFTEWPLDERVQRAIANMNITTPTPVQKLAIGPALDGRDVIAKAETGTGKTLAFGAPMISKIDTDRSTVLGLVLCPTRELAQQVAQVLESLSLEKGLNVALLVGGDPIPPQIKQLQKGCQVVVGTPGRVLDLYKQRFLKFPWTEFVVLDEADEMLEIGFLDDVEKIISFTPEERQTLLFSATFPPALLALARKHTQNPAEIATAKGVATVDRIQQSMAFVPEDDVPFVLKRLFQDSSADDLFLVFGERRTDVDRLFRRLERLPQGVKALHGGYDQAARFRVMDAFRKSDVRALIATDVASRGLDVTGVTHVINVGLPREVSTYTHRIGRTGRAGASGHALTLVTPANRKRWRVLRDQMNWEVEEIDVRDLRKVMFSEPLAPSKEGSKDQRERPRGRGRDTEEAPRDETPRDGERPHRGRDRDEDRERRPRRERGASEREERPRRERSETREERPRGERSETREERPRRERGADREERPERSSRTRGQRRGAEDRGASAERVEPRSSEDRPRRSRGRQEDRSGAERPRRTQSESEPRAEREPRPEREERPRRHSRTEAGEPRAERGSDERPRRRSERSSSGDRNERGDRRSGANKDSRRRPERAASAPAKSPEPGDDGFGFGAGLEPEPKAKPKKRQQPPRESRQTAQDVVEQKPDAGPDNGSGFGAGL